MQPFPTVASGADGSAPHNPERAGGTCPARPRLHRLGNLLWFVPCCALNAASEPAKLALRGFCSPA
jgi:hypothetical protein